MSEVYRELLKNKSPEELIRELKKMEIYDEETVVNMLLKDGKYKEVLDIREEFYIDKELVSKALDGYVGQLVSEGKKDMAREILEKFMDKITEDAYNNIKKKHGLKRFGLF